MIQYFFIGTDFKVRKLMGSGEITLISNPSIEEKIRLSAEEDEQVDEGITG